MKRCKEVSASRHQGPKQRSDAPGGMPCGRALSRQFNRLDSLTATPRVAARALTGIVPSAPFSVPAIPLDVNSVQTRCFARMLLPR